MIENEKYYMTISSHSVTDKQIQIKPWFLNDSDFILDNAQPLNLRRTVFVGGVPRPLRSGIYKICLFFCQFNL